MDMPLAILDDRQDSGDPWRRPSFLRGTERPLLERGENLFVRIADCRIVVETRVTQDQPWRVVWQARRTGLATVTDRRLVVGCRRYEPVSGGTAATRVLVALARLVGYRPAGTCLGGHFRYEWVSAVSIACGMPGEASWLMVTASEPWMLGEVRALPRPGLDDGEWLVGEYSRQWRLSVGSVGAAAYLKDLVALVANEVARKHRRGAGPDADLGPDAELAMAEGWPRLRPEPGDTGSVYIPGACPLGARPVNVQARAWRA